MASGTISLGTSNQIQGRIKWSSSSNGTDANSSEVTATIQVKRTSSYTTTGTWTGSLTIDGTKKSYSKYKEVSDSYVTLYSFSKTVKHKDNGDGTCAISGVINGPSGTSQEDSKVSESKTVTLDTIARYATLTSVNNFTDEENTKIIYSHGAGSALDSLTLGISVNGSTDIITKEIPKTQSSCTIGFTDANRKLLREAASASNSKEFIFTLRSRLSGVDYESKKTAVMTVVNAAPTAEPNAVDVNTATIEVTDDANILVAGYSQAKVTVNAAAYKEASISKVIVKNGTKTLSGDGKISPVQNAKIVATVTDSRGNTASKELQNTIIPYISTGCVIEDFAITGAGSMTLKVGGSFYNTTIGKTKNTLTVQYRIKQQGGSYGSWTAMSATLSGNEYEAEAKITGLDYQKNYVIQARAHDVLSTKTSPEINAISTPVFDWGKDSFKFNVPVTFCPMPWLGLNTSNMTATGKFQEDLEATFAAMQDGECKQVQFIDTKLNSQKHTGMIWRYAPEYGFLTATNYSGLKAIKTFYNNVWNDWEWETPPLNVDVEYRTTERIHGKVVYKKITADGEFMYRLDGETTWKRYVDVNPVKTLWQGSWNSGTLTVPNTGKYKAFQICMSGQGTTILAFRYGTHIRGIGGYTQENGEATIYQFTATFSGNTWTFVACNSFKHNADGDHGANTTRTVEAIYGLF